MEIKISTAMSGKMLGINALSTNCLTNSNCQARRNIDGSICKKCYACNTAKRYKSLNANLENNSKILSSEILEFDQLPVIHDDIFRFEAFGDLINIVHAINYLNICEKNYKTTFALYTKNYDILHNAIMFVGSKPTNLIVMESSLMINKPAFKHKFADKTFTVYDKYTIKNDNIYINCGAKSCRSCMLCYTHNDTTIISEILK